MVASATSLNLIPVLGNFVMTFMPPVVGYVAENRSERLICPTAAASITHRARFEPGADGWRLKLLKPSPKSIARMCFIRNSSLATGTDLALLTQAPKIVAVARVEDRSAAAGFDGRPTRKSDASSAVYGHAGNDRISILSAQAAGRERALRCLRSLASAGAGGRGGACDARGRGGVRASGAAVQRRARTRSCCCVWRRRRFVRGRSRFR